MRRRWQQIQLMVAGAALALLVALGAGGAGVAHAEAGSAAAGIVCVRVVNASPAAAGMDVYFNARTKPTPGNFAFGAVSDYWPESGGTQTVYVTRAGQPKSAAFFKTEVQTPPGRYYTLALLGDSSSALSITVFKDDPSISSGNARVRVYHLSPDADVASVSVGGQTVIPRVDFKQASDYLTVKPGTYTFDVAVQKGTKTVPLQATLEANKVTSIFGVGRVNATGVDAFKFVVNTTGVMPKNWPQTGFNPHPVQAQPSAAVGQLGWAVPLGGVFVLLWAGWRYAGRRPAETRRRWLWR